MAALALSLGLLIHFNLIAKAVTAKREIASIRKEMRNQYAALFPREKSITDELYLLKSHLKEIQVKGDAIVDVDLLRLLVEISEKKNQRVVLHELSLDRDLITMKGDADSVNEAETMKVALGGLFKEVSFSEIKPSGAGKFFFTMIAKGRRT
jgi:type II secretory pathway component PulL